MPSDVRAGGLVAGFRIESPLGEGSTGTVHLAVHVASGRRVALKLLTPELARDERFRKRFLRETRLATSLDHPHIVPTLAAGEEERVLFLAMEYVDGRDLRRLLREEGRLALARAVELVAQVAEGLDAAHAASLVHRDVKPGNVLIGVTEDREHAYVCDFGLARHVSSVGSLTGDRGFVGTVDYVAPEQIEGGRIDRRADVYSLGCVLYECLTGERPFERESELAVVYAHLNEPPPRVTERRSGLPEAFDAVVARALAKSPDERYETCGQLAEAARSAVQGRAVSRRRPRRLAYAAVGAGVLVLAAVGALLTLGTDSDETAATPRISQTAIDGVPVGRQQQYYRDRLGVSRRLVLVGPGFFSLAFQEPQVAVYFREEGEAARIVTTWNREHRTKEGIGPCSTVPELKRAYGDAAVATPWAGRARAQKHQRGWAVGRNLLFSSQDGKTIGSVALYAGEPGYTGRNSWRAWANYVAADEAPCE